MQEYSKPELPREVESLDAFYIVGIKKGLWYLRSDVEKYIDANEVAKYIADTKPTAANRNRVHHVEGTDGWTRTTGPGVETLSDKFVRSKWNTLPFRRPCTICPPPDNMKRLDFFGYSTKTVDFTAYRPECTECTNKINRDKASTSTASTQEESRSFCNNCKGYELFYAHCDDMCRSCVIRTDKQEKEDAVDKTTKPCKGCDRDRLLKHFDEDNVSCKACCAKGARNDVRPERREYHNELNKKNKYYETYRQKMRDIDEAAYQAHLASSQRAWHDQNPEWRATWRKETLSRRVSEVKSGAKERKIPYELTDEETSDMLVKDCHYCGKESISGDYGGIDRVDSNVHYCPPNCVASCSQCNYLKSSLDVVTFLERIQHIWAVINNDAMGQVSDAWNGSVPTTMDDCLKRTIQMRRLFRGSVEDFIDHARMIHEHDTIAIYKDSNIARQFCEAH
jgi:hypothetical protein